MTLGDFVKQYRIDNGYSMDDFAKISGLSKGYISMLEKNKNPRNGKPISPSLDTIKQLAQAMHIEFDDLIKLIDSGQTISLKNESFKSDKENEDIKVLLSEKNGLYFRLAKEAKNLELDEDDVDTILKLYSKHREKNL